MQINSAILHDVDLLWLSQVRKLTLTPPPPAVGGRLDDFQLRNCFHSCTTSASRVISTNLPDTKAATIPLRLARRIFSSSALEMLPVEISNNGGSPVTRKD